MNVYYLVVTLVIMKAIHMMKMVFVHYVVLMIYLVISRLHMIQHMTDIMFVYFQIMKEHGMFLNSIMMEHMVKLRYI